MPVEKSKDAFASKQFNCAQSVMNGFKEHLDISEEDIRAAVKHGGGRADAAGTCGALYAALNLARDPESGQRISDGFATQAGSLKCREIRRAKQLSCADCVELAASLLAKEM